MENNRFMIKLEREQVASLLQVTNATVKISSWTWKRNHQICWIWNSQSDGQRQTGWLS